MKTPHQQVIVGVLQFEVLIHGAESLKDKRRVVSPLKQRLHREHQACVSEVGRYEAHDCALLAAAVVAADGKRVGEVLDKISAKLRSLRDGELGATSRTLLTVAPMEERAEGDPDTLADEMLARGLIDVEHAGAVGSDAPAGGHAEQGGPR